MKKLKTVFFGTPEFAVASLDKIIQAGHEVAAVVTMPDKVAGRGHKLIQSDVKKYAVGHGIPVLQPANLKDPAFIGQLRAIGADIFIVIAFRMLPEAVWAMPPMGTFNLHGSLLPKYRGAAPINWAIIHGEKETGVTLFFLDRQIDTGEIIASKAIDIAPDDNAGTIHDRLMELGAEEVVKALDLISEGKAKSQPQPEGEFVAAPKIFKETCEIDWELPSEKIHNLVRGLSPYPAAFTTMRDASGKETQVKIFATALTPGEDEGISVAGKVTVDHHRLLVGTGDGPIEILELMPAGKKRMTAEEFCRGYHPVSMGKASY